MEATRHWVRLIFMLTLTTVGRLIPLETFLGAGFDLYRGPGSAVVESLRLSALITLTVVPPMLRVNVAGKSKKDAIARIKVSVRRHSKPLGRLIFDPAVAPALPAFRHSTD